MSQVSDYLATTKRRDRVMAAVEFVAMFLAGAAGNAGVESAAARLGAVSGMAYGYRSLTRFSCLFDVEPLTRLSTIVSGSTAPAGGSAKTLSPADRMVSSLRLLTDVFFFPCEHIAVLSKAGVILDKSRGGRIGDCGIVFWFWSSVLNLGVLIKELAQTARKATKAAAAAEGSAVAKYRGRVRNLRLSIVKTLAFIAFALSLMPKGGAQLFAATAAQAPAVLRPLHELVRLLTPPALPIGTMSRGALGCVATALDFA